MPAPERLVASANFECCEELEEFLTALGKESVQSVRVEEYALRVRLSRELDEQLSKDDSEVVAGVTELLQKQPGLSALAAAHVAAWFRDHYLQAAPKGRQEDASGLRASEDQWVTLAQLKEGLPTSVDYKRPCAVRLPDGTEHEAKWWRHAAMAVVTWLFERGKLSPMPVRYCEGSGLSMLNSTPSHPNGKSMCNPHEVVRGSLYVEWRGSSRRWVRGLSNRLAQAGEPTAGVSFRLRLWGSEP